jgi:predicted kinase
MLFFYFGGWEVAREILSLTGAGANAVALVNKVYPSFAPTLSVRASLSERADDIHDAALRGLLRSKQRNADCRSAEESAEKAHPHGHVNSGSLSAERGLAFDTKFRTYRG